MTFDWSKCSKFSDAVTLNVGGTVFTTTISTLKSKPDTRLSGISTSSAEYVPELNLFFYDRNPTLFSSVLDFYRTGELHLPKHVCGASIRHELEYWMIGSGSIADCCVSNLFQFEDELEVTNNLKIQFESKGLEYTTEDLAMGKWNRAKNFTWRLLDKPNSSKAAKVFSVVYFIFVVMTCITFIFETHRTFRHDIDKRISVNATHTISLYQHMLNEHNNAKVAYLASTELVASLAIINHICTVFFALELLIRFICCPVKKFFFKDMLNIVDLFIVLFMMISSILYFTADFSDNPGLLWLFLVAKGCIILRLFRLFRLARHYSGLKILYLALRASFQELGLLFLTFMITTSMFGGLIFYVEFFTDETLFENVPIAIWWAIVTLTTVGYGDYYPTTPFGYVVGGVCAMCGLLLLSMPIAIIATNFNDYYSRNRIREKQLKRKADIFNKIKNLFSNRRGLTALNLSSLNDIPDTTRTVTSQISESAIKPIMNGTGPHQMNGTGPPKDSPMGTPRANGVIKNGKGPPTITVAEAPKDDDKESSGPPKRFKSVLQQMKANKSNQVNESHS